MSGALPQLTPRTPPSLPIAQAGRLGFVSGTLLAEKAISFERVLFRATRGNMLLRQVGAGKRGGGGGRMALRSALWIQRGAGGIGGEGSYGYAEIEPFLPPSPFFPSPLRQTRIEGKVRDPASGDKVDKIVFMAFFNGERARAKILKIAEAFSAALYPCPEEPARRRQLAGEVRTPLGGSTGHETQRPPYWGVITACCTLFFAACSAGLPAN